MKTTYKNWYKAFTITLIVMLPILILVFTDLIVELPSIKDGDGNDSVEFYSSFSLAILTSIFGFHKVLNAWLAQRKLISIYHQASSDLKSKLYAFEDRWNDRSGSIFQAANVVSEEFDADIETTITEGRRIADVERTKYYEHMENPEVDLGNIFTSSFSQASNVFKNLQSKRFTRKLDELEKERKHFADQKSLLSEINQLEKHIDELEKLEAETQTAIAAAGARPPAQLTTMLVSIQTRISTQKLELVEKKSKVD